MKRIYLDNAATTPMYQEALEEMLPYFVEKFGNASSLHFYGREAQAAVDSARQSIAQNINASSKEIYFTSGGTESDNWAIKGAVAKSKNATKHIITSVIEHPAVLNTCRQLERDNKNVVVTYVPVNSDGFVDVNSIKNTITDDTILVSIMMANNEIGTIQPIAEIGALCHEEGVLFHTDAVQGMDSIDVDVKKLNVDLLSMSGHKVHGPKGIGVLYVKSGVRLGHLISGGEQERGERAGTTMTPQIVGLAKALEITKERRTQTVARMVSLRDDFIAKVEKNIPHVILNGSRTNRLPGNVNFSFPYIEGESILMLLDLAGISVSSGSACASGSLEASHVIKALGVKEEFAHSTIRFSIGANTTAEDMDYTFDTLKKVVDSLRKMSPIYDYRNGEGKSDV